jgi:uncharacterized protein (DUF305 family)
MRKLTLLCLRSALLFLTINLRDWAQNSHSYDSLSASGSVFGELMMSMDGMHTRSKEIRPVGNNDTDFVRIMIVHHQAAIDMAKTELQHGTDDQMRRLAQEIVTDQESEIELMQLWLKEHKPGYATGANSPNVGAGKEN